MEEAVNGTIVRIVGMARSGNHAIIDWILNQLPGQWCFLNCVEPSTSPFHTARPIGDGDAEFRSTVPGFDLAAEQAGRLTPKDAVLFSHEDTFLKIAFGAEATAIQEAAVGAGRRRIDVLILRDPYNLFASRRRLSYQLVTDRTAVRIWKQHARAFLGERPVLAPEAVRISYNAWVSDRAYRRRIAERLGLRFTDAGIDRVARCAGGSSFDGTRYEGRARQMAVFDRWRLYAGDPAFRALFDAQLADLAERVFGPLPGRALLAPHGRPASAERAAGEGAGASAEGL
ncbi:MAG TPA: hypothetical protein VHG92_08920 [Afifellaceae bacterium]|nr:hypothetical protein [Afifellaceae bacterium]